MMAFIGVRTSWLMLAMNSFFSRLTDSDTRATSARQSLAAGSGWAAIGVRYHSASRWPS